VLLLAVSYWLFLLSSAAASTGTGESSSSNPDNNRKISPRIVGGTTVTNPMKYEFLGDWWRGCGVSLIAPDMVLTAAHCYDPLLQDPITFGSSIHEDVQAPYTAKAWDYRVHPFYDLVGDIQDTNRGENYDYMVLKLWDPLPLQPIELNADPWLPASDGDILTVIGFGDTGEDGTSTNTLQEVNVTYVTNCDQEPYVYANYNYLRPNHDQEHLCAGVAGGGKDACYGDSGGPLFTRVWYGDDVDNLQWKFVQVGIVR
jgi:secreted trypsin-like serine protease